jgi:hypothetical protein
MMSLLRQLEPEMFFVLLIVGGSLAAATVISLASVAMVTWRKSRRDDLVFQLKREMLEQGMSADDIAKVIAAGPPAPVWASPAAWPSWGCGHKKRHVAMGPATPVR